jgi:TLD
MLRLLCSLVWLSSLSQGFAPRPTFVRRGTALQVDQGDDWVSSLFKKLLPTPEDIGLTRFTKESLPEKYPAIKDVYAEILPSDTSDEQMKLVRQVLAQTNLERRPLVLAYSAKLDSFKASAFHQKVDKKGPAVVLCKTKSGGVFGGYNPTGWVNEGELRGSIAAFLFVFPNGDVKKRPIKLQKIGGANGAQFGAEGLTIPLGKLGKSISPQKVYSKLGLYYENLPDGKRSLLPGGKPEDELESLDVYVGQWGDDPIPYSDVLFFQLN